MKRRNVDCPRRPPKRTKIGEGLYGSSFIYVKFFVVWLLVIAADFLFEFRFEYLWPFWLLLRSVYDSFRYQGLAFSILFVCMALTSDMICLLFIPVNWLFFAASTYVWVQFVWHSEKGVCASSIALWVVFIYIEALVRLKDVKNTPFHLDLCRPFAAHCIGYPVVTLGFGLKSYVGYRLRQRKQREVSKENDFYVQLLQEALPAELQSTLNQKASKEKAEQMGLNSDLEIQPTAVPSRTAPHSGGGACNGSVPSNNSTTSSSSHNNNNTNHSTGSGPLRSRGTKGGGGGGQYPRKEDVSPPPPPAPNKVSNNKVPNGGGPHNAIHIELEYMQKTSWPSPPRSVNDFDPSEAERKDKSKSLSSSSSSSSSSTCSSSSSSTSSQQGGGAPSSSSSPPSAPTPVLLQGGLTEGAPPQENSSKKKGGHASSNHTPTQSNGSAKFGGGGQQGGSGAPPGGGGSSPPPPPAKENNKKNKNNNNNNNKENVSKEDSVTIIRLESDLRRLKADLQASRVSEQDLRNEVNALHSAEKKERAEGAALRSENEALHAKLHHLSTARQSERSTLSSLEKKVAEERRGRQVAEAQVAQVERRARKVEETSQARALALANAKSECSDACRSRRGEVESELKRLRREGRSTEERCRALERETTTLRQYKEAREKRERSRERRERSRERLSTNLNLLNNLNQERERERERERLNQERERLEREREREQRESGGGVVSLRQYKESQSEGEVLLGALGAMRDKTALLEASLSAETKIKLDLFSALGDAKRQVAIAQSQLVHKEKEIDALKTKITEVLAVCPPPSGGSFPPSGGAGGGGRPPFFSAASKILPQVVVNQAQMEAHMGGQHQVPVSSSALRLEGCSPPVSLEPLFSPSSPPPSLDPIFSPLLPPLPSPSLQPPPLPPHPSNSLHPQSNLDPNARVYTPKGE